jgi:Heterokaryon incompatibility protein (HET)
MRGLVQRSIDQSNTKDRNHQVQQMADVYRQVHHVLIWLGRGDDQIERAPAPISILGRQGWWSSGQGHAPAMTLKMTASNVFWQEFRELRRNSYWYRLWIVQELVHARKTFLLLGDTQCLLVDYIWFNFWTTKCNQCQSVSNHSKRPVKSELSKHILETIGELKAPDFVWKPYFRPKSLPDLILDFSDLECVENQDKVLGLVSMAKDGSPFQVDYKASMDALFKRTIDLCLSERQTEPKRLGSLVRTLWWVLDVGKVQLASAQALLGQVCELDVDETFESVLHHQPDALEILFERSRQGSRWHTVQDVRLWDKPPSVEVVCAYDVRAVEIKEEKSMAPLAAGPQH